MARAMQGRISLRRLEPVWLEHFPEKWTSGFPQKMRPRKESRARLSTRMGQRELSAL
jgi:hypothetical protein